MGKKIFGIYLAKLDAPNSEAHARLELPASPWELHDAMDKVQLQENEELYLEIDDYYGFEYLAPHLMELDASLNELNDLAGRLAVLDETEQEAFDGLLRLEIQRKVESNGSILTMQDLRTLAVSAGADCCHVVGATSDAELGRFYAENGFMACLSAWREQLPPARPPWRAGSSPPSRTASASLPLKMDQGNSNLLCHDGHGSGAL